MCYILCVNTFFNFFFLDFAHPFYDKFLLLRYRSLNSTSNSLKLFFFICLKFHIHLLHVSFAIDSHWFAYVRIYARMYYLSADLLESAISKTQAIFQG